MAFHSDIIKFGSLFLLCTTSMSCTKQTFKEEMANVTANTSTAAPDKTGIIRNTLYSDFYNWDNYRFTFLRFDSIPFSSSQFAVFESENPNGKDELKIRVQKNRLSSETGYYTSSYIELNANKFSGNNFKGQSDNSIAVNFKPINSKEAELNFNCKITTDIRDPNGNNFLIKNIKGVFVTPFE